MTAMDSSRAMPKSLKRARLRRNFQKFAPYYFMLLPAIVYVAIFNYAPLYGLQIAFKDFKGSLGFAASRWVGLKHFISFFESHYFWELLRNTFALSLYSLAVGFPIPIILALMLNELGPKYKRFTQTVLYAPHFISTVVMVGIIMLMLSPSYGVVNTVIKALGHDPIYFMSLPSAFRHIYVWSGVWQGMGWSAVIYLAALSAVSPELHEAATIDGASRLQRMIHINLPSILPTIMILLIMRIGSLVNVGYEKVYLLQNSLNQEVSEVISTYVYKRGILNTSYSFTSAVGLFNNLINVALLLLANAFSRKATDTSLF